MRLVRPWLVACVAAALLLGACTGGNSGVIEWRDLTLTMPDGWIELGRADGHLLVGDGRAPEEAGARGDLAVAMQITVEPGASSDDWRAFVEEQGGTLERDEEVLLDGVPGRLLQYTFTTNGVPLRERVIVIPSRDLVFLQQPVPLQTEMDGPQRFLDRIDEFDALLTGIDFGAPV